jgi:hypothetical protein
VGPAAADPVVAEPAAADPVVAEPAAADPVVAEPVADVESAIAASWTREDPSWTREDPEPSPGIGLMDRAAPAEQPPNPVPDGQRNVTPDQERHPTRDDERHPTIRLSAAGPVVCSQYGDFRPPIDRAQEVTSLTGLGLTRRSRSRTGSRLFTIVFVAIFLLILVQAVASMLSAAGAH